MRKDNIADYDNQREESSKWLIQYSHGTTLRFDPHKSNSTSKEGEEEGKNEKECKKEKKKKEKGGPKRAVECKKMRQEAQWTEHANGQQEPASTRLRRTS